MASYLTQWKVWWVSLSLLGRLLPLALALGYWGALQALHGLKVDNLWGAGMLLLLYYAGPGARALFLFALPFLLTGILYDSMRYYADLLRGPIHVREPYLFDKIFFGISTPEGRLTPNEWWQKHTAWPLDLVTGLAYILFIPLYLLTCAYFRFWVARDGTGSLSAARTAELSSQMPWAFFWVNLVGYSTYYWYAASPPWYVALYGLGPARLDVPANVAGCARFDALVGLPVFREWYGHSADVHGAVPSLHIAYPLIAALYAWKIERWRVLTLGFYVLICFAAVYLNHHYVLDILWGSGYSVVTVAALWALAGRRASRMPEAGKLTQSGVTLYNKLATADAIAKQELRVP